MKGGDALCRFAQYVVNTTMGCVLAGSNYAPASRHAGGERVESCLSLSLGTAGENPARG